MSNKKFALLFTSDKSLSPILEWMNNSRIKLEFKESCLKQDKSLFTPNNVVNLYVVYELNVWSPDLNAELTLRDCMFGNVQITINADPDKYSYWGYGIGFDCHSLFFIPNFNCGKYVIILGDYISSSVRTDNKNKDILVLGKWTTRGLDNTTLSFV